MAARRILMAARMESSGVAGRVQVADSTWQRLPKGDQWRFKRRKVDAKGFGVTPAYLLLPRN